MLVIMRRVGESFHIGDDVVVTVVDISRGRVRVGIQAPRHVAINREEIHFRLREELAKAATEEPETPDAPSTQSGS
jgi:carbon storage regulator